MTTAVDEGTEQIKAELRDEFPGWSIIFTSRERWWATRNPEVGENGKTVNHEITAVDADTPEQLRAELRKVVQA